MNGTTPLNTPRMIYHWKEEQKGNLGCHLRISVPLRGPELWGSFGNRPEFSEIKAQLFVSGVRAKSGKQLRYDVLGCDFFERRGEKHTIDVGTLLAFLFFLFQMASYVLVLIFVWFFWRWSICKYTCVRMDA